ncbi:hypothetical protein DRF60_12585 [Chryseobacterium elymi]|uniref:Transposase IS4-like domain-containing protein n=2 Tax=Chryseobacterium elymi TaxID=395936 RepID=A0A3D9DFH6_9FLAO|nr:hypothetical protein DRF60_12585 [Chryseobacterium elymi]
MQFFRKYRTNYLTDRQGLPIAMSSPVSGNHNDFYNIKLQFEEITDTLESASISVKGLFMNADAGFDSVDLLLACEQKEIIPNIAYNRRNNSQYTERILDKKLYRERYSIERTNAWTDSYRTILNRKKSR